jgi:hypothetical protein
LQLLLVVIVAVGLFSFLIGLGVARGNVTAIRLCLRIGIPAHSTYAESDFKASSAVNSDVKAWLHIPGVCYSPVMLENNGYYRKHNVLKKESITGELHLYSNRGSYDFSHIANEVPESRSITDLAVIRGSSMIRKANPRLAQLSMIRRYTNSDLRKHHPSIKLVDNGVTVIYTFLFSVEVSLENQMKIAITDRSSFIQSMREISNVDSGLSAENNIIILSGNTGIDNTLIFLVEIEN